MPEARLVITAVTTEKRPVAEVARSYEVARSWIYTLLARYQAEGEAAFEPRSRRPQRSPRAISRCKETYWQPDCHRLSGNYSPSDDRLMSWQCRLGAGCYDFLKSL